MKTYYAKPGEVQRDWVLVDATDMVLGRLATRVAEILKGKTKPQYTPHIDVGDFVVVINAEKIRLTGNKAAAKSYFSHSGYPGGLKEVSFERMLEKHPERIIEKAVKGMLPKNSLGRSMGKKLKVYAGPEHPHVAQNPQAIDLKG
ncbi:MAG: 50S ribosomal protein L13 [Coriobacteriia bacterium]|nr:50S ribosomal protein L13 [Coriobacteriia bacterium]